MQQESKYEKLINFVNEFSRIVEEKGMVRLFTEDDVLNGRTITLKNKQLIHFGSCSYLGLETDMRIKEAAAQAVMNFGSYFSCSRTYVSCGNYLELEELLSEIFNGSILLTTNSTLGHNSVMPIVIGSNDVVIYDQQAHVSMHEMSYKLNHFGTQITVLRHNRLDELEDKYNMFKSCHDKIWYVIDGVYSMFGDLAPVKEIISLLDKHKKLWLYVDDAHGMSWAGKNGSGYTLGQTTLHPKMILGTSMAKGFGSCGGIFVFHDSELRDKVKRWGGPLTYSGPQEPATVAAAIASARIHLSGEIDELQKSLNEKIQFCNEMMHKHKVPLVSESESPIFFVACGLPKVCFNLVQRMMNEGFYTNFGIFPAVPETCSGVRFTITNHITFEDIEKLAQAFAEQHPKALKDEGRTMNDIYKAFRKFTDFEKRFGKADDFHLKHKAVTDDSELLLKCYSSVSEIDKHLWNDMLGDKGAFDHDNLLLLESAFSGNPETENNWKFFYYIIFCNNKPVAASFFTSALMKDDMLAPAFVSEEIEKTRKSSPYYLTSKSFLMGSAITNGEHLFINKKNMQWKKALILMLDKVSEDREKEGANTLFLRDFEYDEELNSFFIDNGFVKIDMPENNIIPFLNHSDIQCYFNQTLSGKKKYQLRKETLVDIDDYKAVFEANSSKEYLNLFELYLNNKRKNLNLNTFCLPVKFFELISKAPFWETIVLINKTLNKIVAVGLHAVTSSSYCAVIIGVEKETMSKNPYKKMLYFAIKRAIELKKNTIYLGITANETKRKFGAQQKKQVAYIQMKDTYNQDFIDTLTYSKTAQK